MVENFPRGKAAAPAAAAPVAPSTPSKGKPSSTSGALAAKRKREAAAAAKATTDEAGPDFLFALPTKKKTKTPGSTSSSHQQHDDDGSPMDEASKIAQAVGLGCVTKSGRGPPQIQPISFKKLTRNTTVLGLITRVGPKDVAVALPGGLVGRVSLPEISDPLYTRFLAAASAMDPLQHQQATIAVAMQALRPGQVVRAVVIASPAAGPTVAADKVVSKSGGKASQKLTLSLRASLVNRGLKLEHVLPGGSLMGAVASAEDHGYVIQTGLEGTTAFLSRKHVKGDEALLSEGSPVEVVVLTVKEASRAITCGFDPKVTPQALTRGSALTLQGLKPGMLVNAAVDLLLHNGLALDFLGGLSGVVTLDHLDRPYADSDWRKRYRLGDMVQARVLMMDAHAKTIYLTLRTHLLGLRGASSLPEVGQVVEQAKVLRVEAKRGLLLGYIPSTVAATTTMATECSKKGKEKKEKKEKQKEETIKDQDTLDEATRLTAELQLKRSKQARAKEEGEEILDLDTDPLEAKRLKLLQSPRHIPIFIHTSQIEKADLTNIHTGDTVSCRIIGIAPIEGALHGSMKATTLAAPFVRLADVTPGTKVSATVTAVAGWGLTLDLGQGIRAHCTNMHLTDGAGPKATSLRAKALAEAKKGGKGKGVYQAGQKVACRILQVDPETRKVYVTMKPSLLKEEETAVVAAAPSSSSSSSTSSTIKLLTTYHDATPNTTSLGFVTKVGEFGVIVTFYNNVHGLLPSKHLLTQGVDNPSEAFRLGQVVRCVVSSCQPHAQPPKLSLRLDVPGAEEEEEENDEKVGKEKGGSSSSSSSSSLRAGQRVSGTVERIQDPYVMVRLDKAKGSSSSGGKGKGGGGGAGGGDSPLAFLHKHHLGDHAALADQLFNRLSKGSRIEEALVLEFRKDKEGAPLLSLKPLLLQAGQGGVVDGGGGGAADGKKKDKKDDTEVPKLTDLKVGTTTPPLCGYVSRVENFGLFVRFVGGQVALAPRALIADRFVEDATGLFREGDSVRCRLQRVDVDKGKVFVTTQRSQLPVTKATFLETLLAESAAAAGGGECG